MRGFRFQGLGSKVNGSDGRVQASGKDFRVGGLLGLAFRVQGLGFRAWRSGFSDQNFGVIVDGGGV